MTLNSRLKEESSRLVSSLLVSALEACRQGDVDLAEGLGLSIETMQLLDRLKPDQIANLSGNYMRDLCTLEVFRIDSARISRIIEIAAQESKTFEMIDEYLRRGACKKMMGELFGLRSTQIANRKKFLSLPTIKGRLSVCTVSEERAIYDSWLATIKIPDYRLRLLTVARSTELTLSKIYRVVQEIEEITNPTKSCNSNKICA